MQKNLLIKNIYTLSELVAMGIAWKHIGTWKVKIAKHKIGVIKEGKHITGKRYLFTKQDVIKLLQKEGKL